MAALFFAFTPDDVARAFDDLEACREAADALQRLNSPSRSLCPRAT